ncbi:phage putative head morphogenesis protein, SPP1 gp7 family [Prevotella dentalis DSM 3688]|uniref:Phage Mu protein F like protein domain protein n=1 Tax=Prevotella dentalis (strain ATCC 49559 / DSM 3688 / JCM 13448 / NCTC 12043 / ES 2772) TaxID=908937 RepID=F9D798_PREDD|nr:phage minor head protein [Prevotella dentalis]AGB29740.1 phage putative head morphogenesis protein, SPP1 gp7 family [Prevotella dentalis DSM 3688]AGB29829.1 phage putative head morphogenesis protein, SPP1 gp7 family [Prevotella dentalis DSM 3688]EGQ11464.1 phage Mu protein F like protein domain protein [Prevotella dentalis DSM 3688]
MERLYGGDGDYLAKDGTPPDFNDSLFSDAARKVYEHGGFNPSMLLSPEAQRVTGETFRVLNTAISAHIDHVMPETERHALEHNAFIFSGLKTFHSLREVGLSMLDAKGNIKPFGDFLKEVTAINEKYNKNYLDAEYHHAVRSVEMANKWIQFKEDGDRYDLQYRTAEDSKVRTSHQQLDRITLALDDPFWESYFPPNGWRCRCDVVQVRKGKYPLSDPDMSLGLGDDATAEPKQRMFRSNPGKSLKLFPEQHPYNKVPTEVKKMVEEMPEPLKAPEEAVDFINASEVRKKWFERGFSQLIVTQRKGVNGYTDTKGLIAMTRERMDGVLSGISKVRTGQELTEKEADAMATLWHEITHNRSKPGMIRMGRDQTKFMELANEFVARKTLPEFYEGLGGKIQHPEFMNDRKSTGYNNMVNCYDRLIGLTGSDPGKVLDDVKEHLFNQPYDKQQDGLAMALYKNGAKLPDGRKLKKTEIKKLVKRCLFGNATIDNMIESLVVK